MNRERIPFDDRRPNTLPPFEIGEEALHEPGPFWSPQQGDAAEHQPTKVLPAAAPLHSPDAATRRLSAVSPHQRFATAADAGNAEFTAPSTQQGPAAFGAEPSEPPTGSELGFGGWARLVIGGPVLLAAAWLLLHGAHAVLGGGDLDALLNVFTLVGAPVLLCGILLLPGPAGGKVAAVVLAAMAYAAMIAPTLLQSVGALVSTLTAFVFAPACVLFGFMTWLSVRGKRPAAWLLIVVPPATAIIVALLAAATPVSVLLRGDALADLQAVTAVLPAAAQAWLSTLPTEMAESTIRFGTLALCVVPSMLLAWPVRRPRH